MNRKVKYPWLALVLFLRFSGLGYGQVVYDDFNDNAVDTLRWSGGGGSGGVVMSEQNQRVEVFYPSVVSGKDFGAGFSSVCKVRGDFDISVDYDLFGWPYANGVRTALHVPNVWIERTSLGTFRDMPSYPREIYFSRADGWNIVGTNHSSGTLRLVRNGSQFSSYYIENGAWKLMRNGSVTVDDVRFTISTWSHDFVFTNREVRMAFDNLLINKGELVCPQACALPPTGMVGWWPGDGYANDLAGDNHGSAQPGASFSPGLVSQAFTFDGSNGFVRVPDHDSLDTPDGLTVDAWIYPTANDGARVIASKWANPTGQWSWIFKLHNDGSGRLHIEISRGDHNALGDLEGSAVLPLNSWSHVAATYDRRTGRMRLYVNGSVDSESSARFPGTAVNNSEADLLIGAVNGRITTPSDHFQGMIDELELHNRALSGAEIALIYRAGSAGKCKQKKHLVVANAGPDQSVEMTSCRGAVVTLDGSGSFDSDGDPLTYAWSWDGGSASGVNPQVILPFGATTVTLTVSDGMGLSATDTLLVIVADTIAPVMNIAPSPNILWPPNHKLVKVLPSGSVDDACPAELTVLSVTSNEPDNGQGDGDTENDSAIQADASILLRAERSGKGSGRVYTITYRATDAAGNSTTSSAQVMVPLSMGGK